MDAEREFIDASVAVWREVDRLEAVGPYPGIPPETDLRVRERRAWEQYRAVLDNPSSSAVSFERGYPSQSDDPISKGGL